MIATAIEIAGLEGGRSNRGFRDASQLSVED